jgi:hypothetical protein
LLQACTGILLDPTFAKEHFSIFHCIVLLCILITIGLMIAIKKKHLTENDINQKGPKNLDSFWLNSVFTGLTIYSFVFAHYLRG